MYGWQQPAIPPTIPPPRPPPGPPPGPPATTSTEFTRETLNTHNPSNIARLFAKRAAAPSQPKPDVVIERRSRQWFVSAVTWFEYMAMPKEARFAEEKINIKRTYREIADESQPICALSLEEFEVYYDHEVDDWCYRGAIRLKRQFGEARAGKLVKADAMCASERERYS